MFTFLPDNANSVQMLPSIRWTYPTNDSSFNTTNYEAVKAMDNRISKIFCDVNKMKRKNKKGKKKEKNIHINNTVKFHDE